MLPRAGTNDSPPPLAPGRGGAGGVAGEGGCPARDDANEAQALRVAEGVEEGWRGHACRSGGRPRGNITFHGLREERACGVEEGELDGTRSGGEGWGRSP